MESVSLNACEKESLVIVIGNTTTTIAVFRNGPFPEIEKFPTSLFGVPEEMNRVLDAVAVRHTGLHEAALCSVVPSVADRCAGMVEALMNIPVVTVCSSMKLPFVLQYENHDSFGADRIALCAWGQRQFPDQAMIAVDIGTAITLDVLSSAGRYLGGMILPGIDSMAAALHSRTAQLPLVSIGRSSGFLGLSTSECIRNGIFWGTVMQIRGLIGEIERYLRIDCLESAVGVVATGGNCGIIAGELGGAIAVDDLAVEKGTLLLLAFNRS
jgi:type III pantothenate kinase